MAAHRNFGYHIKNDGDYWTWAILDDSGTVKQHGRVKSKAIAAACVIRQLVRSRQAANGLRDAA